MILSLRYDYDFNRIKYETFRCNKAQFYFSVLRKLTVNGFVEPHKNMEVMVSESSY